MINSLFIKNFTLIEEANITFDAGLNIITGETGSGKSLIFDSIEICMGGKINTDLLKNKDKKAIIETTFVNYNLEVNELLINNDYEINNELIIRREINPIGYSRIFINDTPSNINFVKLISENLLDFHRQNETLSILKPQNQIVLLDNFIDYNLINNYKLNYKEYLKIINQLNDLITKKNELIKLKDYNEIKLKEINEVNPKINEINDINFELNKLENSEYLYQTSTEIKNIITNDDKSLLNNLEELISRIIKIKEFTTSIDGLSDELKGFKVTLKELETYFKHFISDIEFNPNKIEELRQREKKLKILVKKYGTFDNLIDIKSQLENDLNLLDTFEIDKLDLEKQTQIFKKLLYNDAIIISEKRKIVSQKLSNEIENNLKNLGIENALFVIKLDEITNVSKDSDNFIFQFKDNSINFNQNGIDKVELLFSANIGNEIKPISEIASGGEISRIMLSIKSNVDNPTNSNDFNENTITTLNTTSNNNITNKNIMTLIFDEIDSGVSGKVARLMGKELKKLGQKNQIISITHLPQIASLGDKNFNVSKYYDKSSTFTVIKELNSSDKIQEIAKLIGGENLTENSIKSANELIYNIEL